MGRPEECHCPCGYEPVLRRNPISIIVTEQPKNATVYDDIAIFSISSTIDQLPSYYYQWQKKRFFEDDFIDIPFANGPTLLVSNPGFDDNGSKYRVYIGHYGKEEPVYSEEATLSIIKDIPNPIINILRHPQSIDLGFLDSVDLSVQAIVTPNSKLFYQWQIRKNGVGTFQNINNATSTKLELKSLSYDRDNLNEYRVNVKTSYSSSYLVSNIARITLTKFPKIDINVNPQDTISDQGIANFYVDALTDDGTPLSYFWQRKKLSDNQFINIPQSTSNSLVVRNLNNLQDDESLYRAVLYVSNLNRFKYSKYAKLSVPKSIITAISPNTFFPMAVSGIIDLSVNALITSGDEILYQWQKKSDEFDNVYIDISGANSPTIKLTDLEYDVDDNDIYRVSLKAKYSKDVNTSQFFTINVPYAPKINVVDDTQLISSVSGNIGEDRSFTLFSTAELEFNEVTKVSGELFGVWQTYNSNSKNWIDITGQSGDYFTVNNASYLDYNGKNFRRFYTSDQGSTPKYSSSFTIYLDKPKITIINQPPISFGITSGVAETYINASINFNQTLSYQWQKLDKLTSTYVNIENTNSDRLVLSNLSYLQNNLDRYRVIVKGSDGAQDVVSNFSTLSIDRPIIRITKNISNQTASSHAAAFEVVANITNTSLPLSFQWQKKDERSNAFLNLTDENKSFLLLSNLLSTKNNNEVYRVGVLGTDGAESVLSNEATLNVFPPIISISKNLQNVVSKDSNAIFGLEASATYEGLINYRWKRKKEFEESFSYLNTENSLQPFLSLSGLNFFRDNNSIYQAELYTIDPNTPMVISNSGTLLIPLIGAISNIFNDHIVSDNINVLRLSNLYLDSLINQNVSNISLSNLYLDSLINQNVSFTSLSNISLDNINTADILRIPFSGKSVISDGFISDKLYLNIVPNQLKEGSEMLGYNIELTNISTSTKYNLNFLPETFSIAGSLVVDLDSGFYAMQPSNYNVKIRTIHYNDPIDYSGDYSHTISINYLRPPTPVRSFQALLPSEKNAGRNNIILNWETPLFDGNSNIYYEISQSGYNDSSYGTILSSGSNINTFTSSGLQPGKLYSYKIYAKNEYGYSSVSESSEYTSSLLYLDVSFDAAGKLEYIENKVHANYLLMNLPYIMKIENSIFNLYYDLFYY
jgi:hypothetical protein